jgi:hypothetical protein
MSYVYDAVVVLHFLGLASLVGGFLVQMRATERGINNAMFHGALTQLVTGIILVGMRESDLLDEARELDMTKIGIKLVIALIVFVVALLGRRRPAGEQQVYWALAGGLAILNVIIAVFV